MKTNTINVISESAFTVQGHGVHTAYTEHLDGLRRYSPQLVVHTNDSRIKADIVHIHTVGLYSLRFLFSRNCKVYVSAHVVPDSFVGSLVGVKFWYPLAKAYLKWFYNHADGVFAVSQQVADELKAMNIKTKVYVVPNMLETITFSNSPDKKAKARDKLKIDKDKFVVLCSGQVQPRQRADSFLACAKALPNIQFIWVGGIPFKKVAANYNEMQSLMQNAPSNVLFTGVIQHKDVIPYYLASDVFFLPSEQETFGIVIVEASSAGLPVLLRENNQYKKTFTDGYISAKDDDGFINQIMKVSTDKKYYKQAASKSLSIKERYDTKKVMEQINSIYNEGLENLK